MSRRPHQLPLPLPSAVLGRTRTSRWWLVGALSGLLNLNFLFELSDPGRLPIGRSAVSDLQAGGHRLAGLLRTGDALSAALCLVLALGLLLGSLDVSHVRRHAPAWRRWRSVRVQHRLVLAAGVGTAVYGLGTLLAAVLPLSCAETADAVCAAEARAGRLPWTDGLHDGVSVLGTTSAIVAALLLLLVRHQRAVLRACHGALGSLAGGLGVAMSVVLAEQAPGWFGWAQRVQIVALSMWVAAAGVTADVLHARASGTMRA